MHRFKAAMAAVFATLALGVQPASAVVGGNDASAGEYPAVARITYAGAFLCTGTLVAPNWVLTAGHCSSLTGGTPATPASWPPQLINVRIGGLRPGEGEQVSVKRVIMQPNYLLNRGYDISLFELNAPSAKAPVKVAGTGEGSLWSAGTLETIVGWGATEEGGDLPDVLQEAQVPVTTDAYCSNAYSAFEAITMLCAGYPQGGVDTCQGDSGGPMFGRDGAGSLRVVGATSWGEGCARPGKPGVYGRVGDTTLREWIRSHAPAAVQ